MSERAGATRRPAGAAERRRGPPSACASPRRGCCPGRDGLRRIDPWMHCAGRDAPDIRSLSPDARARARCILVRDECPRSHDRESCQRAPIVTLRIAGPHDRRNRRRRAGVRAAVREAVRRRLSSSSQLRRCTRPCRVTRCDRDRGSRHLARGGRRRGPGAAWSRVRSRGVRRRPGATRRMFSVRRRAPRP